MTQELDAKQAKEKALKRKKLLKMYEGLLDKVCPIEKTKDVRDKFGKLMYQYMSDEDIKAIDEVAKQEGFFVFQELEFIGDRQIASFHLFAIDLGEEIFSSLEVPSGLKDKELSTSITYIFRELRKTTYRVITPETKQKQSELAEELKEQRPTENTETESIKTIRIDGLNYRQLESINEVTKFLSEADEIDRLYVLYEGMKEMDFYEPLSTNDKEAVHKIYLEAAAKIYLSQKVEMKNKENKERSKKC